MGAKTAIALGLATGLVVGGVALGAFVALAPVPGPASQPAAEIPSASPSPSFEPASPSVPSSAEPSSPAAPGSSSPAASGSPAGSGSAPAGSGSAPASPGPSASTLAEQDAWGAVTLPADFWIDRNGTVLDGPWAGSRRA